MNTSKNAGARLLKSIQYAMFFLAIIFFLLTLICTKFGTPDIALPFQKITRPFFIKIDGFVWSLDGIPFLIFAQIFFLLAFFGIAIHLGIKILPTPLSEKDKQEIFESPYSVFNKIIFKRILFGSVLSVTPQTFNFVNERLAIAADLYLLHARYSNKFHGLAFIASILFIQIFLFDSDDHSPFLQISINFFSFNLILLICLEIVLSAFSFYLRKKNNGI